MATTRSLRTRYLWAGMSICLLSLVLVSAFSYLVSYRITSSLLDARAANLAQAKSREFDAWLSTKEILVEGLAQDIEALDDFSNEHVGILLRNKFKLYSDRLIDVYMGFASGRWPISGAGWIAPLNYDARTRPWFLAAAKTDHVIFTEPYLDAMTGAQIITVARAIRRNGQLVSVLASDISIAELIQKANSLDAGQNSYALLIDSQGRILAHPDPALAPTRESLRAVSDLPWPQYGKLLVQLLNKDAGEKIELAGPSGRTEYYTFSRVRKTGWHFGIAMDSGEYMRPLNLLLAGFGAAFVLSMLIGLLVMHRLVGGMIRPVQALTRTVASFSSENLEVRAAVASDDELGRLGRSFNAMADTIADYSRDMERKVAERTRQLQEKNDLIMASIDYASRVQRAILPALPPATSFAIWRPRDVVGGDIYWSRSEGGRTLLAVADCTGHGVPGALMTMTLNAILDAAVREAGLASPARVVALAHARLRQDTLPAADGTGPAVDDGADLAVLLLDHAARRLVFCGARLSLFAARGRAVEEYPGGGPSIGYHARGRNAAFADQDIPWAEGLRLYLTTDGLLDQNQAPGRSGMGRQGFRQLLEGLAGLDLAAQQAAIAAEIDRRLAGAPQRDDICVLGLEL